MHSSPNTTASTKGRRTVSIDISHRSFPSPPCHLLRTTPNTPSSRAHVTTPGGHSMSLPPHTAPAPAGREFIVRSIHAYETGHNGHLSFTPLQYIRVIHCENSGWWLGECDKNVGWFPSNHVERVTEEFETEVSLFSVIYSTLCRPPDVLLHAPLTAFASVPHKLDRLSRAQHR